MFGLLRALELTCSCLLFSKVRSRSPNQVMSGKCNKKLLKQIRPSVSGRNIKDFLRNEDNSSFVFSEKYLSFVDICWNTYLKGRTGIETVY